MTDRPIPLIDQLSREIGEYAEKFGWLRTTGPKFAAAFSETIKNAVLRRHFPPEGMHVMGWLDLKTGLLRLDFPDGQRAAEFWRLTKEKSDANATRIA